LYSAGVYQPGPPGRAARQAWGTPSHREPILPLTWAARSIRAPLDRALVSLGAAAAARRFNAGRTLILAYHNVLPDRARPVGDQPLHLSLAQFKAQLDLLERLCDVVPLTDLGRASTSGRPRAAITFDDAYQGAVTAGVHALVRRGLPAAIFVAPGVLNRASFWWDEAALATGSPVVPEDVRRVALEQLCGDGDAVRAALIRRGLTPDPGALPEHARTATMDELHHAVSAPGITLGSHSWSHRNLARLAGPELDAELRRPLEWLQQHFPKDSIPWLAYPYGLDAPGVHAAARSAGYDAALRVTGGWLRRGETPSFATPRSNIPAGMSLPRFELRLSRFPWA